MKKLTTYQQCREFVLKHELPVALRRPPCRYLVAVTDAAWAELRLLVRMTDSNQQEVLLHIVKEAQESDAVYAEFDQFNLESDPELSNVGMITIHGDSVRFRVPTLRTKDPSTWRNLSSSVRLDIFYDSPHFVEDHEPTLNHNLALIHEALVKEHGQLYTTKAETDLRFKQLTALLNE